MPLAKVLQQTKTLLNSLNQTRPVYRGYNGEFKLSCRTVTNGTFEILLIFEESSEEFEFRNHVVALIGYAKRLKAKQWRGMVLQRIEKSYAPIIIEELFSGTKDFLYRIFSTRQEIVNYCLDQYIKSYATS